MCILRLQQVARATRLTSSNVYPMTQSAIQYETVEQAKTKHTVIAWSSNNKHLNTYMYEIMIILDCCSCESSVLFSDNCTRNAGYRWLHGQDNMSNWQPLHPTTMALWSLSRLSRQVGRIELRWRHMTIVRDKRVYDVILFHRFRGKHFRRAGCIHDAYVRFKIQKPALNLQNEMKWFASNDVGKMMKLCVFTKILPFALQVVLASDTCHVHVQTYAAWTRDSTKLF